MTREEAIDIIKCLAWHTRPNEEDIEQAIKALKPEQEPCEDAISRVETVKFLANHSNDFEDVKIRMAFRAASSLVNNPHNLPPIQPNMGHWINIDDIESECSECGHREPNERFIFEDINFCAKCGAKMESKE